MRKHRSRVRKLVDTSLASLPLCNLRLMPKKLPLLTVEDADGGRGTSYLIGFDIDKERMQGDELHMTAKVEQFREEVNFGERLAPSPPPPCSPCRLHRCCACPLPLPPQSHRLPLQWSRLW